MEEILVTPLNSTLKVRFKGVPFFVTSESQEGGRKTVVTEYPGANFRSIEDMGKIPGAYHIDGFVGGKGDSEWLRNSRRLDNALDNPEEGMLECSVFGSQKVKAISYTKKVDQRELGKIDYRILFLVTKNPVEYRTARITIQEVIAKAADVIEKALAGFLSDYEEPETAVEVKAIKKDLDTFANVVEETVTVSGIDYARIISKVQKAKNLYNEAIRDPISLGGLLFSDGILGEVFNSLDATREGLKAARKLTTIGYNFTQNVADTEEIFSIYAGMDFRLPTWGQATFYKSSNTSNRVNLVSNARAASLATFMSLAARCDYSNNTEIVDILAQIDEAYSAVVLEPDIEDVSDINDFLLPLEVVQALDSCRIDVLRVLEDKMQATPNIVDFETTPTFDTELTYRLYAEEFSTSQGLINKTEVLSELNDILPTRYDATVKVLKL